MEWEKLCTLPVSKGNINFEKFFSFIRKIKYNGTFTVEATAFDSQGKIDTDMLDRCFMCIKDYLNNPG
ncbi:MAG: sugar phosphate isomerase/epimerase [Lachnospiraceae bacterium]